MVEIMINRDSVCLADDMSEHALICQMDDDATYIDLFAKIKKLNYFPNVSGNNVVWVLQSKAYNCIFSYFSFTDKFSPGLSEKNLINLCKKYNHLHFKFFSSPSKWKAYIMQMYNDNTYQIWKDGWVEEIKYCDYLEGF